MSKSAIWNCKAISVFQEGRANLRDLGSKVAILDLFKSDSGTKVRSRLCSKEIAWAPRSPAFSEYLETAFTFAAKKYKEKKIGKILLK